MKRNFIYLCIIGLLFSACSNDDFIDINKKNATPKVEVKNKKETISKFASILSKAVYNNKQVRQFLKNEAIKQFDRNYDVLYYLVKNKDVDGRTFRDILISYSSESIIEKIEREIPLLNILIPKIGLFNIFPEQMNVSDNEIPVAISKEDSNELYVNGNKEITLRKGEIPNFHVIVVNENSRVIIPEPIHKRGVKNAIETKIQFKSPNYDGEKYKQKLQPNFYVDETELPSKVKKAALNFYKDDGSIYQKAFQRDFLYYGITPSKREGKINYTTSEYISFIRINPKTYFKIADQREKGVHNNDPYIQKYKTRKRKRPLTKFELLDRFWTKGSFDFRFEITTSTKGQPHIVYIPLRPDEIWDFNLDVHYRHSTTFRHSKYTYRIDPNKFTSKDIYLADNTINLGKWDISEEALFRYVTISEEDESAEITETYTYDMSMALKKNFKGSTKVGIGLKSTGSIGSETEVNETTTTRETKTYTIKRKQKSDPLGVVKIYFYEPIINNYWMGSMRRMFYDIHTYNTGYVTFGIMVK